MTTHEIALEITKTAIENKTIRFDISSCDNNDKIKKQNEFNVTQISDFYKTIYNAIKSGS